MATTMTLLELRDSVRQRSDMVNSTYVSDPELTNYINQSLWELYDLLIQKYGDEYYAAPPVEFTTNGTDQFYPLPDGTNFSGAPAFYKLLGLDLSLSNQPSSFITLKKFNMSERNRYAVPNFQSFYGVTNMRYRIYGNNLWITPVAQGGQTLRLWYDPRLEPLVDDADTSDGISGWLEYVIVDAAIKCLQKEESDCQVLLLSKAALIQRIESAAENRNAADPYTVSDTQYNDGWWGMGANGAGGWGY